MSAVIAIPMQPRLRFAHDLVVLDRLRRGPLRGGCWRAGRRSAARTPAQRPGAGCGGRAGWACGLERILRSAGAPTFFHDAPVAVLPASWQDTGSGVFTLA